MRPEDSVPAICAHNLAEGGGPARGSVAGKAGGSGRARRPVPEAPFDRAPHAGHRLRRHRRPGDDLRGDDRGDRKAARPLSALAHAQPSTETGFISWCSSAASASSLEQRHPPNARRIVSGKVEEFRDELADGPPGLHRRRPTRPARSPISSRSIRRPGPARPHRAQVRLRGPGAGAGAARNGRTPPGWPARGSRPGARRWRGLHEPETEADLSPLSPHLRRLAYDELLAHQLAMAQRKAERRKRASRPDRGQPAGRPDPRRPPLRLHRRPDPRAGGDPRRPRRRRADEPADPGRCRLRQDRRGHVRHGRRRRRRRPERADGARPRSWRASTTRPSPGPSLPTASASSC